jgi:aspartate/methionine/tyrosine aminotransferase
VLAASTGAPISAEKGTIVTTGTQGALFLAVASLVDPGDNVAIVQSDYVANRKRVQFFGRQVIPVKMDYLRGAEDSRS